MEDGRWKMEDGRWKMEDGRWKMEDGRWTMEDGRWKMEDGRWKMEDGRWTNNFEMNFLDLLSVIFAKIFASFAVKKTDSENLDSFACTISIKKRK
jgi:hypothetical protein